MRLYCGAALAQVAGMLRWPSGSWPEAGETDSGPVGLPTHSGFSSEVHGVVKPCLCCKALCRQHGLGTSVP